MRKLFKTSFIALSALVLPFTASLVTRAEETTYKDDIDTKLEYQISSDGSDIRYISTMELKNGRTLNDITSIQMEFTITDGTVKRSRIETTTTVYDKITGTKDRVDDTYYAVFKITDLTDKYSGWRISSNFTYYFADSTSETVESSSWLIGVAHKYFVQQYTDWGTDMYAYLYGANGNNTWPGQKMTLVDAENHIYEFSYLLGEEYTNVVFNNNKEYDEKKQTNDMPLSSDYDYYIQQDGDAFAHPTTGHDFAHNNDANIHTCSICGYHTVHHLSLTNETDDKKTVTCEDCGFTYTFDKYTIYFTRPNGWGNEIKAYCWSSSNKSVNNGWPGELATWVKQNENNEAVFVFEMDPKYDSIIFNDKIYDSGYQTPDIHLADFSCYNAFYVSGNSVGGYIFVPDSQE